MISRNMALGFGIAATLAAAFLWHGPGGAGERFARTAERMMKATLAHYEMPQIDVRLQRGPLVRQLRFSGTADGFQRSEIRRIGLEVPGVSGAYWAEREIPPRAFPLLAEVLASALACFAIGVVLAYIAALRRRSREAFA